jgi:hypothetical protein
MKPYMRVYTHLEPNSLTFIGAKLFRPEVAGKKWNIFFWSLKTRGDHIHQPSSIAGPIIQSEQTFIEGRKFDYTRYAKQVLAAFKKKPPPPL